MTAKAEIISTDENDCAKKAADIINRAGVIIYPTETLYGIGGLATELSVISKIYAIKERAAGIPMLTLVRDTDMISRYFNISNKQIGLYKKFSRHPLTIIMDQKYDFPDELSAGTKKIGARISSNEFVKDLFRYIDAPIISTSANISGAGNTVLIEEIIAQFADKVDLIVDSGNLPVSKGSTVLDLTTNPPSVLREGDTSKEELKEFLVGNN